MKMPAFACLVPTLVLPFFMMTEARAVVLSTVGVYDATGGMNNEVDTDATGTLASFKSAVTTAYAAGYGGVANLDVSAESFSTATNIFDLRYAYVSGSPTKTMQLISSVVGTSVALTGTNSAQAISGSTVLNRGSNLSPDTTFTFAAPTGEGVTSFAFTVLERNTYANEGVTFTVTAYFSNGTNSGGIASTIGDLSLTTTDKGADDTFWSFNAPAGYSITSVFVDSSSTATTSAGQPLFDDFAFITTPGVFIPEPSSALLAGLGAGLVGIRRRRR